MPSIQLAKGSSEQRSRYIVIWARASWNPAITPAYAASGSFERSRIAAKSPLPLEYKGIQIAKGYVIDLLIQESLVVEIKSVDKLLPIHSAQLMTYMRLQRVSAGLLMNFNVGTLPHGIKRILL